MDDIYNFEFIISILEKSYYENVSPSVTLIANTEKTPFHILISTIISLRTKDKITLAVSKKLFEKIKNFFDIEKIDIKELENLLYPAGFYKTKAKNLKKIASIIINDYNNIIPDNIEQLLKLPGVGRKTANLVLILGYNKNSICVDTHVHRISNRIGWVKTKHPDETEFKLKEIIPQKYWRILNDYLVSYGQSICKPLSPLCSKCGLNNICKKNNI